MGLLKDVPVTKVREFESEFLEYLDLKHRDLLDQLSEGILNNSITDILEKTALELVKKYKP
jgi:F-type H+-transporting ATPase subunit alpha